MPIIDLGRLLPTGEEEERARAFQVNMNYLAGIEQYLARAYGDGEQIIEAALLEAQRDLRGFRRIQRRHSARRGDVARFLGIAWGSEVQLRLGGEAPQLLKYANAWAPVHAYYAVYMSVHAWLAAMDMGDLVDDHASTLKSVSNQIRSRAPLPLPWSVLCVGCPQTDNVVWTGLPDGCGPGPIENLSNPTPETFWPRYCALLRTTRQRRLDKRLDQWKRDAGRKALHRHEKEAVAQKLWPTSLFDYLFRLRVRSNYRDVRSILLAPVGDAWHSRFWSGLVAVTGATTLLLESLVVQTLGKEVFREASDEFLGRRRGDPDPVLRFLAVRHDLLLG